MRVFYLILKQTVLQARKIQMKTHHLWQLIPSPCFFGFDKKIPT